MGSDRENDHHGDQIQLNANGRAHDTSISAHRRDGRTSAIAVELDGEFMHGVLAPTRSTPPPPPPPAKP